MLFRAGSRRPVMSSDKNLVGQERHGVTEMMARMGDKFETCGVIFKSERWAADVLI